MRHPTEGVLRRLLDDPAGVADADRAHVAGCADCLRAVAAVRADADLAGAALAGTALAGAALAAEAGAGVDTDAAWHRLTTAPAPAARPARAAVPRGAVRLGELVRRPAVAALAVAVVVAGASTAAANNWLRIFRTERIAPISFSTADLVAVPDLTRFGDLVVTGDPEPREVPDAAAAAAATGLAVPEPASLPRGVTGTPRYRAGGQVTATFTFRAERAARVADELGSTFPAPPPGVDGSQVRLVAGPSVVALWEHQTGVPALAVARAVAPAAYSSGIPFDTLRDYLLSLPGVPGEVARELRAFGGDGTTLPLPVPADQVTAWAEPVHGVRATVLAARDRTVAAVVWVERGVVTAVAGAVTAEEALATARGLR